MVNEETFRANISKALLLAGDAEAFRAACQMTPEFVPALMTLLQQEKLEADLINHHDQPFTEIRVNLIAEKWQQELWWGQSYAEIKISKLAPVYTNRKIMIQLDYSVAAADENFWRHQAAQLEPVIAKMADTIAARRGYQLLREELSQDVNTGSLVLNEHYRKWKPTVYSVFFENIAENNPHGS